MALRKAANSAAGAAQLDKVDVRSAIDLAAPTVIAQARRRRKLLERREEIETEIQRLQTRGTWLARKAGRLPKNSNGRKKETLRSVFMLRLATDLQALLEGKKVEKINGRTGLKHADRALQLIDELQPDHPRTAKLPEAA